MFAGARYDKEYFHRKMMQLPAEKGRKEEQKEP